MSINGYTINETDDKTAFGIVKEIPKYVTWMKLDFILFFRLHSTALVGPKQAL